MDTVLIFNRPYHLATLARGFRLLPKEVEEQINKGFNIFRILSRALSENDEVNKSDPPYEVIDSVMVNIYEIFHKQMLMEIVSVDDNGEFVHELSGFLFFASPLPREITEKYSHLDIKQPNNDFFVVRTRPGYGAPFDKNLNALRKDLYLIRENYYKPVWWVDRSGNLRFQMIQ